MANTSKWSLTDYFDVWGNAEDGWDVNNWCVVKEHIEMLDDATDADIIAWLYWNEFVNESDEDKYEIEYLDEFIEIYEKETMLPLYSFRREAA